MPSDSGGGGGSGGELNSGGNQNPRHQHRPQQQNERQGNNGRRGRRGRGRGGPRPDNQQSQNQQQQQHVPSGPPVPIVPDGTTLGWFDAGRDGGYIRRAAESYLPTPADAFVPLHLVRQFALRRGDLIEASTGHDHRGRTVVAELITVNEADPALALKRTDFTALIASYPDRKLTLETGRPAKGGPELTRRAIDLIAPIGYGQRALIVAPARAGKTMLLQAITEGVAINHPNVALLILLVDERPEEVS
jgi:transcription termination factor Rho